MPVAPNVENEQTTEQSDAGRGEGNIRNPAKISDLVLTAAGLEAGMDDLLVEFVGADFGDQSLGL